MDFPRIGFSESPIFQNPDPWVKQLLEGDAEAMKQLLKEAAEYYQDRPDTIPKSYEELFEERRSFYDFVLRNSSTISIPTNSLFCVLSDQLFGSLSWSTYIRDLVVDQLKVKKKHYQKFVLSKFEEYCDSIRTIETECDATFFKAFADVFHVKVVVLTADESIAIAQHRPTNSKASYKKVIYIGMSSSAVYSIHPRIGFFAPAFEIGGCEISSAYELKRLCTLICKGLPSFIDPISPSERRDYRLKLFGFEKTEVAGNGDCVYQSLSHQIYGSEHRWAQVRATVVAQLINHDEKYRHLLRSYNDFCLDTSLPGNWASEISIMAVGDAYKVKIVEICSDEDAICKEYVNPFQPYKKVLQICTNMPHCDSMTQPRHRV